MKKVYTKFHEATTMGKTSKTQNTLSVGSRRRRRSKNDDFKNGISPEPSGIFRRCKRQREAYVRDFLAAKLQLSDSCENIAGDWQNLALICFSGVM